MEINEQLDTKGLIDAPHGAVVDTGGVFYVKCREFWQRDNYIMASEDIGNARLIVLPEDEEDEEDDLAYEQRIIAYVRGQAFSHGVWNSRVEQVFEDLGITVAIQPDAWMNRYDRPTLGRVPAGTLLQVGTIDHWQSYAVWLRTHQTDNPSAYFERITGGWQRDERSLGWLQIVGGDIDGEWDDAPESVFPSRTEFRRTLWEVGRQAKADESWCPSFERVMLGIGIDADRIRAESEPSSVDTEPGERRYEPGARIRRIPGHPHTLGGEGDYHEASDGALGTVTQRDVAAWEHAYEVQWDESPNYHSIIDASAIEPAPVESRFEVGQIIRAADLRDLPEGTVCRGATSGQHYRRLHDDQMRTEETGTEQSVGAFVGQFEIEEMPEPWPAPQQMVTTVEQLNSAPVGSCISILNAGYWRKNDQGQWIGTVSGTAAHNSETHVRERRVLVVSAFEGEWPPDDEQSRVRHAYRALGLAVV